MSESSSQVDESSPPRDSPSPESSSSEDDEDYHDTFNEAEEDEEHLRQRHQRLSRRGSMPEREIDEDDTETAALQSTLRRYSSKTRLTKSEDGDNLEDREADHNPDTEDKEARGRDRRRGGSNPEREIVEDDTETAAFQSSLRRLAASKTKSVSSPQLVTQSSGSDGENSAEVSHITSRMTGQRPAVRNKTIFRPSAMRSGRGRPGGRRGGGLQRSRTWQGFSSGLRYESVSDAGMPPPPTAPPTPAKR